MATENALIRKVIPVVLGLLIGGGAMDYWHRSRGTATASSVTTMGGGEGAEGGASDALKTDVTKLKANAPSQSHTMMDVGFHWTNLWFAAEHKNWPLAKFYFDESRSHILWTIRIRPVRKGPDGNDVDLMPIFQAIDTSAFKAMTEAIAKEDPKAFGDAYRMSNEACFGCHKASGKLYLKLTIPTAPTQTLIDFNPDPSAK